MFDLNEIIRNFNDYIKFYCMSAWDDKRKWTEKVWYAFDEYTNKI